MILLLLLCIVFASVVGNHVIEGDEFQKAALRAHNTYRRIHAVPNMTLDSNMNADAMEYAAKLVESGKFEHSSREDRPDQGENLAMACGLGTVDGSRPVEMWYNEVKKYNFDKPGYKDETGHFTQVVWKGSTKLGIGHARSFKKVEYREL